MTWLVLLFPCLELVYCEVIFLSQRFPFKRFSLFFFCFLLLVSFIFFRSEFSKNVHSVWNNIQYISKQNSLLSPVVAMHPPSTIRSSIGSMTFPTESTRFNRRESNGVCMHISISHHLSTQPPQHTTPCNLLDYPPKLTTHTYYTIHATHPSKPPHHRTIQTNYLISPLPLCTHSRPLLFYLAFS
jgi:hypothetical protein